jgi:hypothetical protein
VVEDWATGVAAAWATEDWATEVAAAEVVEDWATGVAAEEDWEAEGGEKEVEEDVAGDMAMVVGWVLATTVEVAVRCREARAVSMVAQSDYS